ncbi:MAG: hypothetical protein MI865_00455, partial [Proteobacteria bacterium]|nr:hypothetical protein [Pseudomonadota bacterium]
MTKFPDSRSMIVGIRSLPLLLILSTSPALGDLTFEPSWDLPNYAKVRAQIDSWIEQAGLDDDLAQEAHSLWPSVDLRSTDGPELLDRVVETFALTDERAQSLIDSCNANRPILTPPEVGWLSDPAMAHIKRRNLLLYYGRWLAQHGFYDEAVEALVELTPADVVDPAGLLFYRAIAYQQLVQPEESRAALIQLLEHEEDLPQRFLQVARLLQRDLSGLKDESLDHIARRM